MTTELAQKMDQVSDLDFIASVGTNTGKRTGIHKVIFEDGCFIVFDEDLQVTSRIPPEVVVVINNLISKDVGRYIQAASAR